MRAARHLAVGASGRAPVVPFLAPLLAAGALAGAPLVGCAPAEVPDAGPPDAGLSDDRPAAGGFVTVDTERVGGPVWEPVDFRLVPAEVGTAATGYGEALAFVDERLGDAHAYSPTDQFFLPEAPHQGPYQVELERAFGDISRTTFTIDEFTPPGGVVAMFTLVPLQGAPTATSHDAPDGGPVLPDEIFPLTMGGEGRAGDEVLDEDFYLQLPAPSQWTGAPGIGGASHVVLFFPTSHEMAPEGTPLPGSYSLSLIVQDATEQGWTVDMRFTVGKPCTCDDECGEGGTCALTPAGIRVCAATCTSDDALCPAGQVCVLSATPADGQPAPGACQTSSDVLHPLGTVCTGTSSCEEGVCLQATAAGRSVCRRSCESDAECPALYSCFEGACLLSEVGTACAVDEQPGSGGCAQTGGGAPLAALALAALGALRRGFRGRARRAALR